MTPQRTRRRRAGRPRRRARPAVRPPGARGRGRRRPPPAVLRAARHGQDDAGPAARHDPPAARPTPRRSRSPASTRPPGEPVGGRLVRRRPFRAPHHTASTAALVGGGSGRARPGEITLAHRGVLFLDELGEFAPSCARRAAPTARGAGGAHLAPTACRSRSPPRSSSSRARTRARAARARTGCRCSDAQRERYRRRLSAPLLDRFDLRVRVDAPEAADVRGESSADVARAGRSRVRATTRALRRLAVVAERARGGRRGRRACCRSAPDADDAWRDPHRRPQPHRTRRHPDPTRRRARSPTSTTRPGITADHLELASAMRGDVP